MENIIKYFYNINVINIRQNSKIIFVEDETNLYAFLNCDNYIENIEEIYKLNKYLIYNNIYMYEIIENKFNEIMTINENHRFVLIKIDDNYNKKIDINMIYNFQYKIYNEFNLKVNDWKMLWMNKIDYYEYHISTNGLKYPILKDSISYFIGMSENAISALDQIENNDLYIQHRRITCNSTHFDFYNPLNIIIDTRVRDLCEYYKSCIIYKSEYSKNIIDIIRNMNYTVNEYLLFYIRMLFPTYYFDMYEKVVSMDEEEKSIYRIINKIDYYYLFLQETYTEISKFVILPNIYWINKKNIL